MHAISVQQLKHLHTLVNSSSRLVPRMFGPGPGPCGVGGVNGVVCGLGCSVGGVKEFEKGGFGKVCGGETGVTGDGVGVEPSDDSRLFCRWGGSGGVRRGGGGGGNRGSRQAAAAARMARVLLSIRCGGSTMPFWKCQQ